MESTFRSPLSRVALSRIALSRRALLQRAALLPAAWFIANLAACSSSDDAAGPSTPSVPANDSYAPALGVNIASMIKKSDDLYVQDLVVGTGSEAISGRTLQMNYSGWLANGTPFDSSIGRGPFSFRLGAGQVIAGWDQGITGMRVGGKRKLVIGSNLGYGPGGSGPIPSNATLVFDVELIGAA